MAYSVAYDSVENMIIAKITGKAYLAELYEFGQIITRMVKARNCFRILTDLREGELNISVTDMYLMPNTLKEISEAENVSIYSVRRAIVTSNNEKDLEFYETVMQNRNYDAKLFHDMEEAKAWLRMK